MKIHVDGGADPNTPTYKVGRGCCGRAYTFFRGGDVAPSGTESSIQGVPEKMKQKVTSGMTFCNFKTAIRTPATTRILLLRPGYAER